MVPRTAKIAQLDSSRERSDAGSVNQEMRERRKGKAGLRPVKGVFERIDGLRLILPSLP